MIMSIDKMILEKYRIYAPFKKNKNDDLSGAELLGFTTRGGHDRKAGLSEYCKNNVSLKV